MRRRHVSANAAGTAKAPRVEEEEIEPLTVEEARRILDRASQLRNGTRWAIALSRLRQGETLGMQWASVDISQLERLERRWWTAVHPTNPPHAKVVHRRRTAFAAPMVGVLTAAARPQSR